MPGTAVAFTIVLALFSLGAGLIAAFGAGTVRRDGGEDLWRYYGATALIVAAVLVPAAAHPAAFALVAAAAAWRGVFELAELQGLRMGAPAHAATAAAALACVVLGASATGDTRLLAASSIVLAVLAAPLYTRSLGAAIAAAPARWLVALAFPLLAAAQLSYLAHLPQGFLWIFFLYATVEVQDSMAFLFGRLFGRRPILPRLSPRKTLEGAIAGALLALAIGSLIAFGLLGEPWPRALGLAALAVAAGFCGDVFASGLKRRAGVKDFRPLHALHGGILDIYDSTLFAGVVLGAARWL